MAQQSRSLKVFVSYSRADVGFADQLVLALEDKGFDPILDRHDVSGAENWRERLGKLILSADAGAGPTRFSADGKRVVAISTVGVRRFDINPIVFAGVDEQVKMACERIAARGATGFSPRDYGEYGFLPKAAPIPCGKLGVAKAPAETTAAKP